MDNIDQLQTDDSEISDKDRYVIDMIFNTKKPDTFYNIKQIIVATLLFSLLSLPMVDMLIGFYTKLNSDYYKLFIKTLLFFSLYFLIINYVIKK
jgi:hypothetical protein